MSELRLYVVEKEICLIFASIFSPRRTITDFQQTIFHELFFNCVSFFLQGHTFLVKTSSGIESLTFQTRFMTPEECNIFSDAFGMFGP